MSVSPPDKFKSSAAFWNALKRVGLDPAAVLRQSGLSLTFSAEDNKVTTEQYFSVWRAMAVLDPDPALGLKLAAKAEPEHYHPAAIAAFHARSYGDALARLARYKQLCAPEELRIRRVKDEVWIDAVWLYASEGEPPLAVDLGFPAVLDHRLVAVGVSPSTTPVTIYGWADGRSDVMPMMPLDVQVWARAGRITMVDSHGQTYRLTMLSKEESAGHRIGEHWPLGESANRAKQVAKATAHDVGHALTFPVWLAHTTHLSGARNAAAGEFLRKLAVASPGTVVQRNQTFGTPPTKPNHLRPYDRRGLVGHEGYPGEL